MFRGIGKQTINEMIMELNDENRIVQWFIEGTEIPASIYSKLTLKSILKEEYFDEVSNLIVKSIFYGRSASASIIVGREPYMKEYDMLVVPKGNNMVIDIKMIT